MSEIDRGYFKVARAVFDHPVLRGEPYNKTLAWLSLIADAAWTERWVDRGGRLIKLERGQLAVSHRFLSERWGWEHHRVARFLGKLAEMGMIRTHTASGIGVLTIVNYDEYQGSEPARQSRGTDAPRIEAESEAVTPNGNASATMISEIVHRASEAVNEAVTPHGLSENRGKTYTHRKKDKNPSDQLPLGTLRVTESEITKAFEEWWQHYPRKVEKGGAKKKYTSVVKRGEATIAELLDGAKTYADTKAGTEARFVKHPTTWLNNGCWADEQVATSQQSNRAKSPDADFWRARVKKFLADRTTWSAQSLGPSPGDAGCRVPGQILAEFNIRPP